MIPAERPDELVESIRALVQRAESSPDPSAD
jgi:hypothetical protein